MQVYQDQADTFRDEQNRSSCFQCGPLQECLLRDGVFLSNSIPTGYDEKQMRSCVQKALAHSDLHTNIEQHKIVAGA